MATSPSASTEKSAAHSKHLTTSTSTAEPLNGYEGYEYYVSCTDFYDPSCFSFGFNFFTLEFPAVILLTLFHASMLVFLIVRGRTDKAFREAFYVQFMAVSVVDCVFLVYTILDKVYWSLGLYSEAYIAFTRDFPLVTSYAQAMLHCLIAVNRFTAFFYPLDHSSIWSRRVVGGSIAAIVILSALLFVLPHYGLMAVPTSDDMYAHNFPNFLRAYGSPVDDLWNALICLVCALGGFLLSIITLVKLRVVAKNGHNRETHTRRDITLLFHSSLMMSTQVLVVVCPTVQTTYDFVSYFFLSFEEPPSPFLEAYLSVLSLSAFLPKLLLLEVFSSAGTPLLLLLSKHVRKAYWEFYFGRSAGVKTGTTAKTSSDRDSKRNRWSSETKSSTLFTTRIT